MKGGVGGPAIGVQGVIKKGRPGWMGCVKDDLRREYRRKTLNIGKATDQPHRPHVNVGKDVMGNVSLL